MRKVTVVFTFILSLFLISLSFNNIFLVKGVSFYYVSTSGSDSNPGTAASPWQHLQYAVDHAAAGGTVINAAPGTYNERISLSGKIDITLQNGSSQKPVITGTGFSDGTLITIAGSSNITISGFELSSFTGTYVDGIVISDGSKNINISNCRIHDINTSTSSGGSHAILAVGNTNTAVTNVVISNNEVYNIKPGYSESVTVVANVDGWSITNNIVHDINNIGIDAAGHFNWGSAAPSVNQARNGIISGNTVYNCNSPYASCAGIYVDGGRDIIIEKNRVYGSQYGIEVGCENPTDQSDSSFAATASGVTVRNNLLYNNSEVGLGIGGYNGTSTGKVINSQVLNNTLYKNGGTEITLQRSNSLSILNNILYGTGSSNYLVTNDSVNAVTNLNMNYNLYYVESGTGNFQWRSSDLSVLSSWQSTVKSDSNSKFGNPSFVNAAALNFQLQAASTAIDSGVNNTLSGSSDFAGNTRVVNSTADCGAYEYQGSAVPTPTTTAEPAPTTTPAPASANPPTPIPTPAPPAVIIIDGSASDWASIPALASSAGQNITSLKMTNDNNYYYFCIEGTKLNTKYGIFLDTDNNSNTGYRSYLWTNGADYYIESGILYKSNGTGWSWTSLGSASLKTALNSTVQEIRLVRSAIKVTGGTIKAGVVNYKDNWSISSYLPLSKLMSVYKIK